MNELATGGRSVVTALLVIAAMAMTPAFAGVNHGIVAYYPFEGDANDQTGNGHDGIGHGGFTFVTGFTGLAASFDGFDDFVELPRMVEDDFTVVFWVRTIAVAPSGSEWWQGLGMVDAEVCGTPQGGDWGIALLNGGYVLWASVVNQTFSSSQINDGNWYSVAVTRDSILNYVTVSVNGVEEGGGVAGSVGPLTGPPWIGVANNPCDVQYNRLWFPGEIDELRFYERILSPFEIRALSQDFIFFDDYESGDNTAWSNTVP